MYSISEIIFEYKSSLLMNHDYIHYWSKVVIASYMMLDSYQRDSRLRIAASNDDSGSWNSSGATLQIICMTSYKKLGGPLLGVSINRRLSLKISVCQKKRASWYRVFRKSKIWQQNRIDSTSSDRCTQAQVRTQ